MTVSRCRDTIMMVALAWTPSLASIVNVVIHDNGPQIC